MERMMRPNVVVVVRDHEAGSTHVDLTHNTVCEGWHELLIRLADPEDSLTHDDLDYHLDIGSDENASPGYTDTAITQKVTRIDVSDFVNEGTQLYVSTFVGSNEANPTDGSSHQSLWNIGVVAEVDGESTEYLCNHSTIAEIQKNEQKTATLAATLQLNNDTGDA